MASPVAATTAQPASSPAANTSSPAPVANDTVVEVDENDSAFGGSNSQSDWTSVTSSIYRGVFEHGRRYQALRQGGYWSPADDQQYESVAYNHLAALLHDQNEENQFFRSPIKLEGAQILDIGCGEGQWAMDVADTYTGREYSLLSLMDRKDIIADRPVSFCDCCRSPSRTPELDRSQLPF